MAGGRAPFVIVYTALGGDHVHEAAISAYSAKRHMPGIRTLLFTDRDVACPYFDEVHAAPAPQGALGERSAKSRKVDAALGAHAERVLLVDSDTYFLGEVSHVWETRRPFEIAAVHDTWQYVEIYRRLNGGLPEDAPDPAEPFFNCGVLFLRKTEGTVALLERWRDRFLADARITRDQLIFRELVYSSGIAMHVLPSIYNARAGEPIHLSGRVRVLHRYSTGHLGFRRSSPFLGDFLNSTEQNR
ncbi:MAG TPA: putative nucleotide-diphospho-sugar transferase, partial [Anaeromyxobacter sp.]|nr:putative nucleotide-diphospho-sugar transferase [Anaeromyxobacter sp.]